MREGFGRFFRSKAEQGGKSMPAPLSESQITERKERNVANIERLSPEAGSLIAQLKDPSLTTEDFFAKLGAFNSSHTRPQFEAGIPEEIDFGVRDGRSFSVKVYPDTTIIFSGRDSDISGVPNPYPEKANSIESPIFEIPKRGEFITLRKMSVENGQASNVAPGQELTGRLLGDIEQGSVIQLDDTENGGGMSNTGRVSLVGIENGVFVVHTATSTYELIRNQPPSGVN